PLWGSTAMSAGRLRRSWLSPVAPTLAHAPVGVSQTNFVPICSSSLLPSCDHFCTTPSPLPASQTLSSLSMKQPSVPFGKTAFLPAFPLGSFAGTSDGSPQLLTTLPSRLNSMTGGAAFDGSG